MKKVLLIVISSMFALSFCFTAACGVKFKLDFIVDGEVYYTIKTQGKNTIELPENPTKENDEFDGWFWDDGVWEKPFTANSLLDTPLSSDMKVYCKWKTDVIINNEEPENGEEGGDGVSVTDVSAFNHYNGSILGLSNYGKSLSEIIIPEQIHGFNIVRINNEAFNNCNNLKSIVIAKNVTEIDGNPFANCTNLTSIMVDSDNPVYKSENNCIIVKHTNSLIVGCNTSVIPDYITSIEGKAFHGSNISSVVIPKNVTTIGGGFYSDNPFANCKNLTSIMVDSDNPVYKSENNCIIVKQTNSLIVGCKSSIIPNSVESIGYRAFYGVDLIGVSVPDSVKEINPYAFSNCVNYTIEANLRYIGNSDNKYLWLVGVVTQNLTTAVINENCKNIKHLAFQNCKNISSVVFPVGIKYIGRQIFIGCTELNAISYTGTVSEWANVDKPTSTEWAFSGDLKISSIQCDNGITPL